MGASLVTTADVNNTSPAHSMDIINGANPTTAAAGQLFLVSFVH